MPNGITAEMFGDIAMIADFVYTFRDLLVPRESLHISIGKQCNATKLCIAGFAFSYLNEFSSQYTSCMPFLVDNLSQALVAGNEGSLLSRILFIFLQILLQDRSTKVSLELIIEQIFAILHPV